MKNSVTRAGVLVWIEFNHLLKNYKETNNRKEGHKEQQKTLLLFTFRKKSNKSSDETVHKQLNVTTYILQTYK